MARPKLGAYIRNVDYLGAKTDYENSDDNPGNQLIDYERLCERDDSFSFDELKDGYAAFREKVCVSNFTGRHSGPYWAAFSTACVLNRLSSNFEDKENYKTNLGRELVTTWFELYCARPSSGHLDLLKKFTGDLFKEYLRICPAPELAAMLSRMKITLGYDTKDTDSEQTYAMFLHSEGSYIFKVLTEDQYQNPKIKEVLLDLHMHYQQQIPKLSTTMGTYVGYFIRDLGAKFPNRNPYSGSTDVKTVKSSLSSIRETLCTFEGNFESLKVDDVLKNIMESALQSSRIKDIFPELMEIVIQFSKRKTPMENEEKLYEIYRRHLTREMEKHVDDTVFDSCVHMLHSILTDGGSLGKEKQELIKSALSDCACKLKNMSPAQGKKLVELSIEMLKSGRIQMAESVKYMYQKQEIKKAFVWKDMIAEVKQILTVVGTMTCDRMEQSRREDFYELIREQRDVVDTLLEMFMKSKILPQIQEDLVSFIFNCLEIDSPHKYDLAGRAADNKYLTITTKHSGLVDTILEKADQLLKRRDIPWDSSAACVLNCLLLAVRTSYGESSKNVTESQNAKFMSIFASCCEGETLEERMFPPEMENHLSPYYLIYQSALPVYFSLHIVSKTLARCVPAMKCVLKTTKLALEEDNGAVLSASLTILQCCGVAAAPEMAEIAPDVVELFMTIDDLSNLTVLVQGVYPYNPEAIHSKLQDFIDKLEELSDNQKITMLTIINDVATKHPEQLTSKQIGQLLELATQSGRSQQTMCLTIVRQIAAQRPKSIHSHFSTLTDDSKFENDASIHLIRIITIIYVGLCDEKSRNAAIDYLMKDSTLADKTNVVTTLNQTLRLLQNDREYIQKYKPKIEKLEKTSTAPEVKEACRTLIDVMEGKSLEGFFEDIQQAQEDIAVLDKKVGATMTTVVSLGEHVISQDKEISGIKTDVNKLEVRVDEVEEDLGETKVKVEEIDNKTMTNAPKWSRDLTKLMNPEDKYDWRLLAKRLGYNNDDIRGWAQQNDPCMALLSEWYATHKTSEATFGLLTNLQEMNRLDAVTIVENAMKVVEGVVEDEEFEYPSPPPIFLSYQWGVQNEVKLLKQHLNKAGYECWMDIGQMGGGDKLFNKIDQGVRAAKVVISCTTEKYAQSPNCNREVNLAVNLGKPIIPLMMEKMSWPPKGSMGPIFSEYLFVRFFQRPGEETNDQRYWPLDKFKELLMQLNFYVVPDQKLVQPEYSNWWKPIIEEVKIVKKDNTKETNAVSNRDTSKETDKASSLVFLSYQWGRQPQVKALYQKLVSMGYSVWMDIFQMGGGDSLYDKIDRGIRGCKVVVSCVTPKYALSANCRREISLADALKKPLIPLLLEEMKWPPDGPMSMVFTELLFINMYRDPTIQEKWIGPKVDEMVRKLKEFVPEIDPVRYEDLKTEKDNQNKETAKSAPPPVAAVQLEVKKPQVETREDVSASGKIEVVSDSNKQKDNLKTNKRDELLLQNNGSGDMKSKSCIVL